MRKREGNYRQPDLPATPKEARTVGSKFYFTNKPCLAGHVAPRRVNGNRCTECERVMNAGRKEYIKDYHKRNPEKNLLATRKYKKKHREKVLQARRDYFLRNKARYAHWAAARRARILKATPPWADFNKIEELYERAAELTRLTRIPHVVDHIIPLISKTHCGLHVHNNLRVITRTHNAVKGNKIIMD